MANATIYVGPTDKLWRAYQQACDAKGVSVSASLRDHMARTVQRSKRPPVKPTKKVQ